MNKNYHLVLILSILSFSGFAQDRIIKITKDTINCQVKEIGDDEVKYTQKEFKGDLIFGIDKNKVSRIIFSDGKELKIKDSMYDASQYEKQHKNAFKFGFLSPLFGATSFTYERSLKPGNSLEGTVGIIGLGSDIVGNSPHGAYFKFGYKFIKSPDIYMKGTRFDHILKGAYIKPEFSVSSYNVQPDLVYENSGSIDTNSGSTESNLMFAFILNAGKQWVIQDRFLVDWFIGAGYGFGNSYGDYPFHYAFVGGSSGSSFVMTSGIRIGVLF
jgi:hypothetical protein